MEEVAAGLDAHHGQEQHDADLAQRQVGAGRHEPVQLAQAADTGQDDGHHQRAAGQAELERHRQAGHVEGDGAQQHAQADADEDGHHLHLLQLLLGVAHQGHHGVDVFLAADQVDHVAELQGHAAGGNQFDAGAVEPGDHHVVVRLQVEVADLLADDGIVGDDGTDRAVGRAPGGGADIGQFADDDLHALEGGRAADQVQHVTHLQPGVHARDEELLAALETRIHHVVALEIGDIGDLQAIEVRVGDAHVAALQAMLALGEAFLVLAFLGIHIDAEHDADEPHGEQDAQDADRVGDGVAHAHDLGAALAAEFGQHLLARSQRGRVGDGTGEDAENDGQRDVQQQVQQDDHDAAQADDGHGHAVQAQAALAQRGEEARAHLDADRVDEQDEPELLDEVHRVLIEREIVAGEEVSDDDAAEKHSADAQADAAQTDVTDAKAQDGDQGQQADGECDVAHGERDPYGQDSDYWVVMCRMASGRPTMGCHGTHREAAAWSSSTTPSSLSARAAFGGQIRPFVVGFDDRSIRVVVNADVPPVGMGCRQADGGVGPEIIPLCSGRSVWTAGMAPPHRHPLSG